MSSMVEENFPRGGVPKTAGKGKKWQKREENDLFKISSSTEIPQEKKTKKRAKKYDLISAESSGSEVISSIEKFSSTHIVDDMLLLGRVREIHDYKLVIALPENILGDVAITDICAAYTDALKKMAGEDDENHDVSSLDELFTVGQLVCCRVKNVKTKERKKEVHLTLDPKSINRDFDCEKVNQNTLLAGSIMSREDHGFTVDIGLPGFRAFLLNADAVKNHGNKPLPIGMPVQCSLTKAGIETIKSKSNRVINIKLKNETAKVMESVKDAVMSNLLPGTVVSGEVVSIQANGIIVKYLGKFKGAIHRHHLNADLSKFKKEQQLRMCILFHLPFVGISYLSMLQHLVDPKSDKTKHHESIQVGEIVESASVLNTEAHSGALLKLRNEIHGYLPLKYVDDNPKKRKLSDFSKTGLKCRVIDFDLMNNVAIVSCCKSFLDRSIIKLSDCKPGQIVEGKIQRFIKGHIVVLIAGFYRGFVPEMHNANVPLKHPEKKYKIDDTIKCRILKLEKSMRHAVSLTAKEALVTSKLPILNSMDMLEKGLIVEGFIVRINPSGLVVAFYNDMRGFVHKSEAGDDLNVLQENFYVGQVVKCRVIAWELESDKIRLSMKLEGQENVGVKEMVMQASLDARTAHACQIVKITDKGLSVRIGQIGGFIPIHHLSDNLVNCKHLLKLYKPHQLLERVVLFERAATPIFTLKQSILKAFEDAPLAEDFDELLAGMTVPGVVRNAVEFGIFVQLSHNLRGVAVNKFLTDSYVENAGALFRRGQSVLVHVRETDRDRNRISCSLRMSDCYQGDTVPALGLLASFLNERKRILDYYGKHGRESIKTLTTMEVGSVIEVEIEQVNEFGSVGHEINSKVKVICTIFHMEGCTVKVGEVRRAIVLYQDLEANCLEATMSKKNVKSISQHVDESRNKVKLGEVIDAQVLLVKPEFVLIALRGRAEYKLAYAPAQKCLNDVTGSTFFEPGFSDKVEVKKVKDDWVVCSWQAYEESKGKVSTPKRIEAHKLEIGSKIRAVVREILPFQLNIRIGAIPGRIFASEIETGDFLPGDRLSDKFKPGDQLDAVVIGFRDTKSQKLVEHMGDRARGIPECSTLARRLAGDVDDLEYEHGQSLPGFYYHTQKNELRFRISPAMNAHCRFLNADLSLDGVKNPCQLHAGAFYPLTFIAARDKSCEVSMVSEESMGVGTSIVGAVWRLKMDSLLLKLPWQQRGTVTLTELSDEYTDELKNQAFREGQYVRGQIIKEIEGGYGVSLRESRRTPLPMRKAPRDKIIESPDDLIENEIVRGFVHRCTHNAVTVQLGDGVIGVAKRGHISDQSKVDKTLYQKGKVVTVKILGLGKDVLVSLKESDTGVPELGAKVTASRKRKNSDREEDTPSRKRKLSETETETTRKRTESGSELESPALGTRKRRLSEMSETKDEPGVDWEKLPRLDLDPEPDTSSDEEVVEPKAKVKKVAKKAAKKKVVKKAAPKTMDSDAHRLKVNEGFAWVTDFQLPTARKSESESSDEEDETPVVKENKKLEEKRLIELENRLLDTSRTPETEDEFDRLVVQSPDSSMMWMQYMAHHLKMAEVDKARSIAERALKTISFREEQEKLNVWVAFMNLENTYGTPEQLKAVFDRAVQTNDSYKVHAQLVKIYENTDKVEQAERLYSTMVRQFGPRKQVWTEFANFYFTQNRYDSARKILERSLKTLDRRDHMEVVSKFGRLEFEHGQDEQAILLFERVLAEAPKRLDAWNVYLDLLVKFSTVEKVRRVFLKLVEIQFPAKKMKTVYKKWLDFETKHGDETSVKDVKDRATKYAQSNVGN